MSKSYDRSGGYWKRKGRPNLGEGPVPYRPTNVIATGITDTAFTLSWQASGTPDETNYPVTNYKIYRDGTLLGTVGNVLTSNQSGLLAGSIYTYEVSAVNAIGESLKSYPTNVTMTGGGGGAGVPDAPTITAGTMLTESSAKIDWTAPVGGNAPTGYRVYRGGTFQVGADLASNVFTLTETGLPVESPPRIFNYTVKAFNGSGESPASNTRSLQWNPNPNPDPLFAGHVPFTVLWGIAAADSGAARPQWDTNPTGPASSFGDARTIVGTNRVFIHRYFNSSWITQNQLTSWLANADSLGIYAWCSFKSSDWAGVAAGNYDAALNTVISVAKARRDAGKRPFAFAIDHEPEGNSGAPNAWGTTYSAASNANRAAWAAMSEYCSDYFAGWKNGVYTAANDVTDIMAWTTICNGQFWKSNGVQAEAGQYYPDTLINKMKVNKGVLAVDQYDAMPGKGAGATNNGIPASGIPDDYSRASTEKIEGKVAAYINWCRAKNTGAIGWGEIGATVSTAGGGAVTPGPLTACWRIMRDNRDIVALVNYFNSIANSRWDWRLIPDEYPVTSGSSIAITEYWPGLKADIGGTAVTAARLAEYKAIVDESQAPPYNQPL